MILSEFRKLLSISGYPASASLGAVRTAQTAVAGPYTASSSVTIQNASISASTAPAVTISTSGVSVRNSTLSNSVSHGLEVRGSNIVGTVIDGNTISAPNNFGALVNTTGDTGGGQIMVTRNTITTGPADTVEINCPQSGDITTAFVGSIVALNFLNVTNTSGPNTAGFAVGIAAPLYNAILGNVVLGSLYECFHVEDSQRGTSIVGNVGTGRFNGVHLLEANSHNAYPVSVVGNNLSNSLATPTATGICAFWDGYGSMSGCPWVGNVLANYAQGLHVGGVSGTTNVNIITAAYANSLKGCTAGVTSYGCSNYGWVRQVGTNVADSLTTLFQSLGHSTRFGKMICGSYPINFALNAGYAGSMPSMADGFEVPLSGTPNVNTSATNILMFPVPGPCHGRAKFQARSTGSPSTSWAHISADINWDGTTFTVSNVLSRVAGHITAISMVQSSGNVYAQMTASVATVLVGGCSEFDGEWWDA